MMTHLLKKATASVLPALPEPGTGRTRRWLLAAAAGLFGLASAQGQALNYQPANATVVAGTYTDLGSTGSVITTANFDDSNSTETPIGFNFVYNGSVMTHFILNTNGFIKLGTAGMSAPNADLYSPTPQNNSGGALYGTSTANNVNLVSPLNLDLYGGAAANATEYRVATTGASPNRVTTIQWEGVSDFPYGGVVTQYTNFSFQVKLYETSNQIEFVYGPATGSGTDVFKSAQVGLKGSGTATNQIVSVTKGSGTAWTSPTIGSGPIPNSTAGFNFRSSVQPVPGTTYRFQPTFASDLAVQVIYTLGQLPRPYGGPHTVRARVRNVGTTVMTNFSVTLTVSGANTFTNTQTVATLGANASTLVTFAPYTPTADGLNTVTVSVSGDDNAANDTQSLPQTVTTTDIGYANAAMPTGAGVSFGAGGAGSLGALYTISAARVITQVRAFITSTSGTMTGRIYDEAGNVLGSSAPYTITAADLNTLRTFTLTTPVLMGAGNFMAGVTMSGGAALGAQPESPTRGGVFFQITAGPTVNDLVTNNFGKLYIDAVSTDPPACQPVTAASASNVTNNSASLSFTAPASGVVDYTISLSPSAGATFNANPTGSPVSFTTLTPGTAYTATITTNCGAGATSSPVTVNFTTLQTNDAATTLVYTQGQLPIPFGAPHVVRATVRNTGFNTLTNLPVILSVTGANTFSNTQTVASLAPGASATVTFLGYTPTNTGTNTVTVSVGADDFAGNDAQSVQQLVTNTTYGYATAGAGVSNSVGFSTGSGLLLSRFSTSAARNVTAVNVFLSGGTTVGKTVFAVVLSPTGTILGQTANYVVQAGDANTLKTFTFATPVTLSPGNFFVGLGQTASATGYFPLGVQDESPTRAGAFFIAPLAGGVAPSDVAANNLGRFYIEAVTADLPPCSAVTNISASNVTGTSAVLNFTAPANGANDYTITLSPAGGTFNGNPSASPVSITGLAPGTTYTATIVSNCGGGTTSAPATFSFNTVPTNDQCSGSVPLLTCGSSVNGTTLGSTSTNDPTGTYGGVAISPAAGGVFYRFEGTGGLVTMSLCSSMPSFDSELFVFTSCGTSPTAVAADDDACSPGGLSAVSFVSDLGTMYYVYVSGFNGAARGNFTLATTCTPLTDKVVSGSESISGAFRNVTVLNGGSASLGGNLQVQGTMTIQNGGRLVADCVNVIFGTGSFVLAAGAELQICDPQGLENNGLSFLQVEGTRSFSNDANYVYNGNQGAQDTGSDLPATVRSLTVNNAPGLTLSQAVNVRQVARLLLGNLRTAGNTFTLLSGPGGTALVDNSGGVVSGTGTMQRAITRGASVGYRHYSSPVSNTTIADLAAPGFTPVVNPAYNTSPTPGLVMPFPNVFGYDETRVGTVVSNMNDFDKGWFTPASVTEPMVPSRGYTVNIPSTALVDFVGTFNNGTQSSGTLTRGTNPESGWHLLGNPYPSPLDWSTVGAAQRPGVDAAIYVYRSTSQYKGTFRSYVNGVGGASPLINAGQGYFTRVSTPGSTGSVNLTNANRVTTFTAQPAFGRGPADTRPLLNLQVEGAAGSTDNAYVYFEQGATAGTDASYDAVKLANPSGLNLATLAGNQELAINGLPALGGLRDIVVPLMLRAPQTGTFELEVAGLANFGSATVYLRDAQTGTQQPLSAGTRYGFTLTSAAATTRFSLVFRGAAVTGTQPGLDAAQVSLYPNPAHDRFTVLLPPVAGQKAVQATLLNALGQVVSTRAIALNGAGAMAEFNTQALPAGVYLLRLDSPGQSISKRLIIK